MSGRRLALALLALAVAVATAGLGVWQVERRAWKHALVARVEVRLAAPPVAPPPPSRWTRVSGDLAYTRVRVAGRYRIGADAYVQAVTDLGPGWWVLTPLATAEGVLLVDRGFVPAVMKNRAPPPPSGRVVVTGLLRVSEPGGGFLRSNDPASDRWYSRDTAAIGRARGLGRVAPFFVDREAGPAGEWPRGGLTVVHFPDNHLIYALTWFTLAGMGLFFAWRLLGQGGER